jgi:glycosyltransferase involved in cell wall biosynthesis
MCGANLERVTTLSPGRLLVQPAPAEGQVRATLAKYTLERQSFVLLPGPTDQRHNHMLALTAFALFRARHPRSTLRLVCPAGGDRLRRQVQRMGVEGAVQVLDRIKYDELLALMAAARGVLVASLVDTTGEMALQAMALARPVLCSAIPDLLELTQGAALTFDPHRPADLVAVLEHFDSDPIFGNELGQRVSARISALDEPTVVAQKYGNMLREAQCQAASFR